MQLARLQKPCCARPKAVGALLRAPRAAISRAPLSVVNKLVLKPTGDGSTAHLDGEAVPLPEPISLEPGEWVVGRAPPATVVIPVPTVSSYHAKITVDGDSVLITDLGSTNGTLVNGEEVLDKPVPISVGSEVIFGDEFLAKFKLETVA